MTFALPRLRPLALAAGLAALLAFAAPASPAAAHDQLVSSDPAADAVLDAAPAEVTLTFSAELLGDGGSNVIEVTDAAGEVVSEGPTVVDGITVTQALGTAASGPLTVLWRVVSSDGHPISGEFAFTVESAPSPTPASGPTTTAAPSSPEPTMSTMTEPAETASPTPAPDAEASAADPLPWILGAVLVLAVIALVIYLLVIRPRRRDENGAADSRPSADD